MDSVKNKNIIADKRQFSIKRFILRWEWMLVLLIVVVNIINGQISENYFNLNTILDSTKMYLDKSFLVFSMALVILIGGIDISVASTIALSSTIMGVAYTAGVPMLASMILAILTGIVCGALNGVLIVKFKELAPMIITLATMSLYRGIAWIILEAQSAGGFPDWHYKMSSGTAFTIGSVNVPIIWVAFILCAVLFGFLMHKTTFGKKLYSIGHNSEAARYSAINVDGCKFIVYLVSGFMASIVGLFLSSRIATVRPNIAMGYELEVIAIVVLGGFKTDGGTGTIVGATLSMILISLIRYGLGRVGVRPEMMMVIIGALLIVAVLLPNIAQAISRRKRKELLVKQDTLAAGSHYSE